MYDVYIGIGYEGARNYRDNKKINAIKELRIFSGLDLKQSKHIVDAVFDTLLRTQLDPKDHHIVITMNAFQFADFCVCLHNNSNSSTSAEYYVVKMERTPVPELERITRVTLG